LPANSNRVYVLALLLAAAFFAAQLHGCIDLNPGIMGSHPCPVCYTLGAAIATCAFI